MSSRNSSSPADGRTEVRARPSLKASKRKKLARQANFPSTATGIRSWPGRRTTPLSKWGFARPREIGGGTNRSETLRNGRIRGLTAPKPHRSRQRVPRHATVSEANSRDPVEQLRVDFQPAVRGALTRSPDRMTRRADYLDVLSDIGAQYRRSDPGGSPSLGPRKGVGGPIA
jgi:hypothetical protein